MDCGVDLTGSGSEGVETEHKALTSLFRLPRTSLPDTSNRLSDSALPCLPRAMVGETSLDGIDDRSKSTAPPYLGAKLSC